MNVVCVTAHQDDEKGCLGTLLKYRRRDDSVHLVCVTNGNKGMSFRPEVPLDTCAQVRRDEMIRVALAVGASYTCLEREDGFLADDRALRIEMIETLRRLEADLVFTHWTSEYNRDHETTSRVVTDSSLFASIASMVNETPALARPPAIFYMDPGEGYGFEATHFVELDEATVQRKEDVIRLHQSQNGVIRELRPDGRDFADLATLETERQGSRAMVRYAEAFRPCLADRRIPLSGSLP